MSPDWPIKKCIRCGIPIRFIKTKEGWNPFELEEFTRHTCERTDAYDRPDKIVPRFSPKKNRYQKR